MAKYVDIEPVIKRLTSVCMTDDSFGMGIQMGINRAMEIIGEARIVDAVEVVYCKDCVFGKIDQRDELFCDRPRFQTHYVKPHDFCSYGIRRE